MSQSKHGTLISREGPIHLLAFGGFLLLVIVMFGDLAFRPPGTVVSHIVGDGSQYFSRMRAFGFEELSRGNLPLWNPYIFSGTPFVGGFQSGMFYPLNLIYLALPVDVAMNLDIAAHVLLTGFLLFMWARGRGVHPLAAFFGGVVFAYGGACFARVLAGHITMLQAMSWAPLVLLAIDKCFERRGPEWVLVGIGATTMQLLAGHPQSVFITGFAAGTYALLRLVSARNRLGVVARLAPIAIVPLFLSAVQLWTGVATARESIRSGGVSFEFASTFSFHPESLASLIVPDLFGNTVHVMYWGRWAYWDSTVFMGIAGLSLAMYGTMYGQRDHRRFSLALALILIVLAFGSYTPIYRWFYAVVPGVANFRSPSKFIYLASMFGAMLAAAGVDTLIQTRRESKGLVVLLGALAVTTLAFAVWLRFGPTEPEAVSPLQGIIDARFDAEDTFFVELAGAESLPKSYYEQATVIAILGLIVASVSAGVLAVAFSLVRHSRAALYVLVGFGIVEVLVFARVHRATFNLSSHERPLFDELYRQDPGDYRVLDIAGIDNAKRNYAMDARKYAIWGYDPVILGRYAEYVVFAAGLRQWDDLLMETALWGNDPLTIAVHERRNFLLRENHKDEDFTLFRALRCKHIILSSGQWRHGPRIWSLRGPLPRFLLYDEYRVLETREAMFDALADPGFDPAATALLETAPEPAPEGGLPMEDATIRVLDEDTDHVTLEVSVPRPALLGVTDAYSEGWRVVPLPGTAQANYDLLPMDYALRCIPLAAGTHRFRMEYAPIAFRIGAWVSAITGILFLAVAGWVVARRVGRRREPPGDVEQADSTLANDGD